jgi:hypothetical protein
VGLFANLRRMWRGHDEKLADRAYHDDAIKAELREESVEDGSELTPVDYAAPGGGVGGGVPIAGYTSGEPSADALRSEDELEHEEPG